MQGFTRLVSRMEDMAHDEIYDLNFRTVERAEWRDCGNGSGVESLRTRIDLRHCNRIDLA